MGLVSISLTGEGSKNSVITFRHDAIAQRRCARWCSASCKFAEESNPTYAKRENEAPYTHVQRKNYVQFSHLPQRKTEWVQSHGRKEKLGQFRFYDGKNEAAKLPPRTKESRQKPISLYSCKIVPRTKEKTYVHISPFTA